MNSMSVERKMAAFEAVVVAIVGRVATWMAPAPSAILIAVAAGKEFGLGEVWSAIIAFSIEFVGMATTNLWLTAREWNATKRKSDPEANERLAIVLVAAYLIVSESMLLSLENWVAALFPLMSAVAMIALGERTLQHKRAEDVRKEKEQRRKSRESSRKPPKKREKVRKYGAKKEAALDLLAEHPDISSEDLAERIGSSRRYAGGLINEYKSQKH